MREDGSRVNGIGIEVVDGYEGRPVNVERNENIAALLKAGMPWAKVQEITRCSRGQAVKIAKAIAAG
jgi:hypothetical protein